MTILNRRLIDSERTFAVPPVNATILEWTDDHVRQLQRFSIINQGNATVSLQFQEYNGSAWVNLGAAIAVVAGGGPVSAARNPQYNRVRLQGVSTGGNDALCTLQYALESDLDTAVPPGDTD